MLSMRRARVLALLLLCCLLAWLSYLRLSVHVQLFAQHVGFDLLRDDDGDAAPGLRRRFRDIYQEGFLQPTRGLCPLQGQHVDLLILVASHPQHSDYRAAIRHTWGQFHGRQHVVIGFMLGRSSDDHELARLVAEETANHSDVIVNNNVDSYANLTLKTAAIFEWVRTYCPFAAHVLKTDDDVFINVPRLLTYMRTLPSDVPAVYGRLRENIRPERYTRSKYFMSARVYPSHFYPAFTTGGAYLTTPDVTHNLLDAAYGLTYLPLEDVFFTGVAAQRAGVLRVAAPEITNQPYYFRRNACLVHKAITFHVEPVDDQYRLWGYLLDRRRWCVAKKYFL